MEEGKKSAEIDRKTQELLDKWKQQAELLKKQHPKWNSARIQEEMKKRIIRQAKEAIPEKSRKAYLEELNTHLRKLELSRNTAIDKIMAHMGKTSPESVAVALFELNCGCIRACAVGKEGGPMGEMVMVSGMPVEKGYECGICAEDGGADPERLVRKAMVWPGEESEMPDEEYRLAIGRKVFGDDYSLDDI